MEDSRKLIVVFGLLFLSIVTSGGYTIENKGDLKGKREVTTARSRAADIDQLAFNC